MTIESTPTHERSFFTLGIRVGGLIRLYMTVMLPVMLVLIGARLAMTETFLRFEYQRPGFPVDVYGFTTEDRLQYAPYAVDYLINGEDISYLEDLTFPNGTPLYTASELNHMEDVQTVTRMAFLLLMTALLITALMLWTVWKNRALRDDLRIGLLQGSLLTLSIIGVIVVLAITAWDVFFTGFHQIFFESGTWRFAYSDTLIRLFPEQFWFDAAIFIGGFAALISSMIVGAILLHNKNTARGS